MADEDTDPDMTRADRHVYGPRAVSALIPGVTRLAFKGKAGKGQSMAGARIMLDWPIIVGPALAAVTTPRRLSAGTLTIACSGPIAMELQHLASEVVDRVNTHVGQPAVRSLRFMQVSMPTATALARSPPARAIAAAQQAVSHLPAGELRDALAGLGSVVLAAKKPFPTRNTKS